MGVWSGLREFSAATQRTARTEGAAAESLSVSQRGFRVDSAPSLSSTETTGPAENRLRFLLTSEQRALNLISPGRIDHSLLVSLLPGLWSARAWWCAIKCFACMHLLLCPYGFRFVFQGTDWPESNISAAWTVKNISSLWIPFGFKVTENIMFLTELTHTEIIWTSSLGVCTSEFTTDFMFYTDKGIYCGFARTGFISSSQQVQDSLIDK